MTWQSPSCPHLVKSTLWALQDAAGAFIRKVEWPDMLSATFQSKAGLLAAYECPWWSMQTACCQSVNEAQAFQFSHGEVCVTEPRGQTHEAMCVCALLDTQPHLPLLLPWLNFEIWKWKQNPPFLLSFSSLILSEGLLSVSLSSPV